MNRRRLLWGLGTAVSGGAIVTGSGAFSTVEADRQLTVGIESDSNAYLEIRDEGDYSEFAEVDSESGTLTFAFSGEPIFSEADGLGKDSIYEFHSVFSVVNGGDRQVRVFGDYNDDSLTDLKLTQSSGVNDSPGSDGKGAITESGPSDPLDPGDGIYVGIKINTKGMSTGSINTSINIIAASDDSDRF